MPDADEIAPLIDRLAADVTALSPPEIGIRRTTRLSALKGGLGRSLRAGHSRRDSPPSDEQQIAIDAVVDVGLGRDDEG